MRSRLHGAAVLHNHDPVCGAADSHPMRNDDRRALPGKLQEAGQNLVFYQRIQGAGGLIQDNQRARRAPHPASRKSSAVSKPFRVSFPS